MNARDSGEACAVVVSGRLTLGLGLAVGKWKSTSYKRRPNSKATDGISGTQSGYDSTLPMIINHNYF